MSGRMANRLLPCYSTRTWITTYGILEIIIRLILLENQSRQLKQLEFKWDMEDLLRSFSGKPRGCPSGNLYYSKMDLLISIILNLISLLMIFLLLGATRMRILKILKIWLVFAFGMTVLCFVISIAKNCSQALLMELFYVAYILVLASGVSSLVHEIEEEIRTVKNYHHRHRQTLQSGSVRDTASTTTPTTTTSPTSRGQVTPHVITMSTLPMFPSSTQRQCENTPGHTMGYYDIDDPAPPPYEDFQPPPYAQISLQHEKRVKKIVEEQQRFDGLT